MTLEIHQVAGLVAIITAEEMVKAHFVECGGGGEGGQVTAQIVGTFVGPYHHSNGVPANDRTDIALDIIITRTLHLFGGRYGIAIRAGDGRRLVDTVINRRLR